MTLLSGINLIKSVKSSQGEGRRRAGYGREEQGLGDRSHRQAWPAPRRGQPLGRASHRRSHQTHLLLRSPQLPPPPLLLSCRCNPPPGPLSPTSFQVSPCFICIILKFLLSLVWFLGRVLFRTYPVLLQRLSKWTWWSLLCHPSRSLRSRCLFKLSRKLEESRWFVQTILGRLLLFFIIYYLSF